MPNQVVWPKCNVFDEDGNATVLKRGELVPDGVDAAQLETLAVIGAVRPVEFAPEDYRPESPQNEPVESEADRMSDESSGTLLGASPVPGTATEPESEPGMLQKPSPEAPKRAWVDYASDARNPRRIERSAATNMSKEALMDRFRQQ